MYPLQVVKDNLPDGCEAVSLLEYISCPAVLLNGKGRVIKCNDEFLMQFPLSEPDIADKKLEDVLQHLENNDFIIVRNQSDKASSLPSSYYLLKEVAVQLGQGYGSVCLFEADSPVQQDRLSVADIMDFLEHANDLVQSVAPDGSFLYVNNTWKKVLGYTDREIRNLRFTDIISEQCRDHCSLMFHRVMQGESVEHVEVSFRAKDGRIVYAEGSCNCRFLDGKPVSTRGIFRDITERKRIRREQEKLKERLKKAELFESLGLMAGSIAHDYNNILMIILGFTELLKVKTSGSPELQSYLEKIEHSARRAEGLTHQMLAFAGAGKVYLEKRDLSALILEIMPSIGSMLPNDCIVDLDLAHNLPLVEMDAAQLKQAVKNLVVNALEAIGPSPGRIEISTGLVGTHADFFHDAVLDENLPEGQYCFIQVADSGEGMTLEVREKAFQPFFTTRFQGRGLGLASTLGIVRGHKGAIKLKSSPGKGTKVRIFLPACDN